jgi:hypothetical protein
MLIKFCNIVILKVLMDAFFNLFTYDRLGSHDTWQYLLTC